MTEAEIQLQNALTTTFLSNLVFLSNYDNDLYKRVDNLSRMIEDGSYKERYFLEFVMENGDFDIFDSHTSNYMYHKNSKRINEELIKKADFKHTKAIFNVEGFFEHKSSPTIDINFEFKSSFSSLIQNHMQEYSKTLNDFLDSTSTKTLKKIKKFIFFGTLLGRHIPEIAKKLDSSLYFVVENNLEIFRLSLFTVDYSILAKNDGVIFSIMEDDIHFENKLSLFLNIGIFDNYLIKFIDISNEISYFYNTFISTLASIKPGIFDYSRYLYTYIDRTTKYIHDNYNFLQFNKIKKELKIFENTPVLYLAAGPSLDENIDWIYENQDKFYIVTIGSVYKKLLNNNIRVDLLTTLDDQKWLERTQFSDDVIKKSNPHTIFLASSITNKKILEKIKSKNLFLYEVFQSIIKDNYYFDGHSIGELTLDILLQLNFKQIYLLGLDLSLNQETGQTHSIEAESGIRKISLEEKNNSIYSRKNLIKVKGNLKKEVKSIELFYGSIKDVENKLKMKNIDTKVYNLSRTGAYFEGTIPKDINEINIKEFKKIDIKSINLKDLLNKYSINTLDEKSTITLKNSLNYLKNKFKMELDLLKNSNFTNYSEFNSTILKTLSNLQKDDISNFYYLLHNYYHIVVPYLNYHFNSINLNQEYKKVEKLKEIFVNQVSNLLEDYILCNERLLKKED